MQPRTQGGVHPAMNELPPRDWDTLPLVDAATLSGLARDTGAEVVRSLVEEFLAEAAERVRFIAAAAAEGDVEKLHFESHALKSTCATFGAARLGRRATFIEQAAKAGKGDAAIEAAAGIEADAGATAAAFREQYQA